MSQARQARSILATLPAVAGSHVVAGMRVGRVTHRTHVVICAATVRSMGNQVVDG